MKTILMLAVGALVILGGLYMARQSFRNTLPQHQPPYTLKISTNEVYQPRYTNTFFIFRGRCTRKTLRDFTMVHEKIMHSIVVRKICKNFNTYTPLCHAERTLHLTRPWHSLPQEHIAYSRTLRLPMRLVTPHGNRTPVTIFLPIST